LEPALIPELAPIGTEFTRYRDAAQRLVRSPWAQRRIVVIADALLRQGTLTREEVCDWLSEDLLQCYSLPK
jgi:hypothetical protein